MKDLRIEEPKTKSQPLASQQFKEDKVKKKRKKIVATAVKTVVKTERPKKGSIPASRVNALKTRELGKKPKKIKCN